MKIGRILGFVCLLIGLCASPVCAAEGEIVHEFREELDGFAATIPEEMRTDFHEILTAPDGLDTMRETYSVSYYIDAVWKEIQAVWPSALSTYTQVLGILIVTAVFRRLQNSFFSESLSDAMDLCSTVCLVLCLTPVLQSVSVLSEQFFSMLVSLTNGITPIMCALFVSSGNLTTAATVNASLMLVYTLFQNILDGVFLPMIRVLYALGMIGHVGSGVRLDSLGRCIRKFFVWSLSLVTLLLSVLIGIQNAMALSVDSFSMKTAKFALGSFIPLVGNALADAVGTVAGSMNVIKNTCGTMGILVMILLLLPSILQLILQRAAVGAAQVTAELLGCEKEGRLLTEIQGVFGYILAVTALAAVLFVFIMALIIRVRF
ncbi:MAG: hypothetical protein IJY85_08615 [Ruminococcus sp.]|nr:hypothetical protein [Clostridia bacterium]MBQ8906411.1 hypothetical protein [Ruminococcus sp.]